MTAARATASPLRKGRKSSRRSKTSMPSTPSTPSADGNVFLFSLPSMRGMYSLIMRSGGMSPAMCERMTLPAPSGSVRTMTGVFFASARMSAAFSRFLNTPKPSVVIICASMTEASFWRSYFPSTITGYGITSFSSFIFSVRTKLSRQCREEFCKRRRRKMYAALQSRAKT